MPAEEVYVFDACAVVALLQGEEGAPVALAASWHMQVDPVQGNGWRSSWRQHFNQLRYYFDHILTSWVEHNRAEVGIHGLERDPFMAPRIAFRGLLALVALDRVPLSGLWVGKVVQLDEDGLPLASAFDRCAKETPRSVGNDGLHGLPHNLCDEHPWVQLVA